MSTELLGSVSSARSLPGGRVLVNDISGRKVVLFDSTLTSFTIVADTTSATANAYSSRAAGLIAYKGDSTLFVDPTSLSMLVIDGAGKVGRVMSIPRPNDAASLIGGPNGTPAFDAQGRMVYRESPQFRFGRPGGGGGPQVAGGGQTGRQQGAAATPGGRRERSAGEPTANGGPPGMPTFPDSLPIVRIDLGTRKVDTLAFVKIQRNRMCMSQDANGRTSMSSTLHPLQVVDDWAVASDGAVALVRGQDYHIDWIRGDGSMSSTAKVPFQWRHMSDSDKVAFIDSTKAAMEKLRAQAVARAGTNGGNVPLVAPPDGGAGLAAGGAVFIRMGELVAAGDGPRPRNQDAGGAPGNFTIPPLQFVEPSELPDYAPPFTAGAVRADRDGNLWIRTTNSLNGGPVYDIVDGKGELIDRVQLPPGRVIAGFAPGGVVYMGFRDGAGARLEQARWSGPQM